MYLVDAGAKKYCEKFGGVCNETFNKSTRWACAKNFTEHFITEADLGNYDNFI